MNELRDYSQPFLQDRLEEVMPSHAATVPPVPTGNPENVKLTCPSKYRNFPKYLEPE